MERQENLGGKERNNKDDGVCEEKIENLLMRANNWYMRKKDFKGTLQGNRSEGKMGKIYYRKWFKKSKGVGHHSGSCSNQPKEMEERETKRARLRVLLDNKEKEMEYFLRWESAQGLAMVANSASLMWKLVLVLNGLGTMPEELRAWENI